MTLKAFHSQFLYWLALRIRSWSSFYYSTGTLTPWQLRCAIWSGECMEKSRRLFLEIREEMDKPDQEYRRLSRQMRALSHNPQRRDPVDMA